MEEYTNRELGLILEEVRGEIKKITKCIEGNGKKGMMDRLTDCETQQRLNQPKIDDLVKDKKNKIKHITDIAWKVAITAVLAVVGLGKYTP